MSKEVNWLGLNRLPTVDEAFERLAGAGAGAHGLRVDPALLIEIPTTEETIRRLDIAISRVRKVLRK